MQVEECWNENEVNLVGLVDTTETWNALAASFVIAACDGWVKKQKNVGKKMKELVVTPFIVILSFTLSFPSFAKTVNYRNSKLDFIYQAISRPIIWYRPNRKWFSGRATTENTSFEESEPEKCVHVDVLYDPTPGFIRADIIFIHGLHGSIHHTWRQGLWGHRKKVQNLPLEHKYKVECYGTKASRKRALGKKIKISNHKRRMVEPPDEDHDYILESITDLLNNIDDTIKDSQTGMDERPEPYTSCWPRDWLPKDCPGVRVIAVNYTTDPFLWRPLWISKRIRSSMMQRSQQMESILLELGVGENPVIWVGHSKGGLFVKQMLVDASQSNDPQLAKFLFRTKGIMFYSVPHRGSSLARWNLPLCRQSIELTEVIKDCREVLELHEKFIKLFEEKFLTAEVFSFVETVLTFMFVTNVRVVSVDSADLGIGSFRGVSLDHREICKPLSRDCFLYKELVALIKRVV